MQIYTQIHRGQRMWRHGKSPHTITIPHNHWKCNACQRKESALVTLHCKKRMEGTGGKEKDRGPTGYTCTSILCFAKQVLSPITLPFSGLLCFPIKSRLQRRGKCGGRWQRRWQTHNDGFKLRKSTLKPTNIHFRVLKPEWMLPTGYFGHSFWKKSNNEKSAMVTGHILLHRSIAELWRRPKQHRQLVSWEQINLSFIQACVLYIVIEWLGKISELKYLNACLWLIQNLFKCWQLFDPYINLT